MKAKPLKVVYAEYFGADVCTHETCGSCRREDVTVAVFDERIMVCHVCLIDLANLVFET